MTTKPKITISQIPAKPNSSLPHVSAVIPKLSRIFPQKFLTYLIKLLLKN